MTHITACFGFLPVAKAFGWASSITYNWGFSCKPAEITKESKIFTNFKSSSFVASLALFNIKG